MIKVFDPDYICVLCSLILTAHSRFEHPLKVIWMILFASALQHTRECAVGPGSRLNWILLVAVSCRRSSRCRHLGAHRCILTEIRPYQMCPDRLRTTLQVAYLGESLSGQRHRYRRHPCTPLSGHSKHLQIPIHIQDYTQRSIDGRKTSLVSSVLKHIRSSDLGLCCVLFNRGCDVEDRQNCHS